MRTPEHGLGQVPQSPASGSVLRLSPALGSGPAVPFEGSAHQRVRVGRPFSLFLLHLRSLLVSGCAWASVGIALWQFQGTQGATASSLGALKGPSIESAWGQVQGLWPFPPAAPWVLPGPCSAPPA